MTAASRSTARFVPQCTQRALRCDASHGALSQMLASAGEDGTVRLWDPHNAEPAGDAHRVRFARPCRAVCRAAPPKRTPMQMVCLDILVGGHTGEVVSAAFCPDGSPWLISAGKEGNVCVWYDAVVSVGAT